VAEAELAGARGAAAAAEKRAADLAWQIRLLAGSGAPDDAGSAAGALAAPSRAGAVAGVAGRALGMLDIFGCAINYNRKGAAPAAAVTEVAE
jgi:hypothetical protein